GCGVDIVYPQENGRLYEKLILKGGIISEYIPGTEPRASLFPPRNRIISGLSDTVIVVEAKEKSGTMITVDMALEQGREVYAIPGRVIDGLSCGCNRLIKQGAGLIISIDEFIDDILKESKRKLTDEVNDLKKEGHNKKTPSPLKQTVSLTKEEQPVYAALDYIPRSIEQISAICPQVTFESLLKILITFCLKGIALQMGAGYYCRREK
ncbi:MAG: DNA-protecting protein DprA, partial [Lachnospiraceae bacterium]|nr:DNA-protecting protein DprA [Lachnospiraceae bacterium]